MINLILSSLILVSSSQGLREVKATSCDVVDIRLAVGQVTQLVFETAPVQTLFASEQLYKITSSPEAPRSVAIIPTISPDSIGDSMNQQGIKSVKEMMNMLDKTYSTNLFVFFKGENQLQFRLRLVAKGEADAIVKVIQTFRKNCSL
jgi:hypothetical protein